MKKIVLIILICIVGIPFFANAQRLFPFNARFIGYLQVTEYVHARQLVDTLEYAGTFSAGEVVFQSTVDGLLRLADADEDTSSSGNIYITLESGSNGEYKRVLEWGEYTTTGLTKGAQYWLSQTAGEWVITASRPSTSGTQVRYLGQAKSTTILEFKPSSTWVEN